MKGISGIYKDMDKPLLFSTIGLFIFGLFNIVTASSSEAVERYGVSIFHGVRYETVEWHAVRYSFNVRKDQKFLNNLIIRTLWRKISF